MENEKPDFSVFKSARSVAPPDWLETRIMARVSKLNEAGLWPKHLALWRYLALGLLVLHLFSIGLVMNHSSKNNSASVQVNQASLFFSSDTYTYSW